MFFANILTIIALSEVLIWSRILALGGCIIHISLASKELVSLHSLLPLMEVPVCLVASVRFILAWISLYLPRKKETKVLPLIKSSFQSSFFSLVQMFVVYQKII